MLQRSYTVLQDRFLSALSEPAEDRYLAFLDRYGDIAQRIPQHYIASYLGITPEALSRVRGKLARKV
jgi:CRP-like cAMP-binding protein